MAPKPLQRETRYSWAMREIWWISVSPGRRVAVRRNPPAGEGTGAPGLRAGHHPRLAHVLDRILERESWRASADGETRSAVEFDFAAEFDWLTKAVCWGGLDAKTRTRYARDLRRFLERRKLIETRPDTSPWSVSAPFTLRPDVRIEIAADVRTRLAGDRAAPAPPAPTEQSSSPPSGTSRAPKRPAPWWTQQLNTDRFFRISGKRKDPFVRLALLDQDLLGPAPSSIVLPVGTDHFPVPAVLGPSIAALQKAHDEWEAHHSGQRPPWDGPKIWVRGIRRRFDDITVDERESFVVDCARTSYFPRHLYNQAFRETARLPIDPIREVRLHHGDKQPRWENLLQSVPVTLGVVVAAFTADGKFLLTRRGEHMGVESGYWNAGVAELLDAQDLVESKDRVDVRGAVMRSIREELCPEEEVAELRLTALGVEVSLYQVQLVAAVRLRCTAREAENHREACLSRLDEIGDTESVTVDGLERAIQGRRQWQPTAIPAIRYLQAIGSWRAALRGAAPRTTRARSSRPR